MAESGNPAKRAAAKKTAAKRRTAARRAEASGAPDSLTVKFEGIELTITRDSVDDVEFFERIEDGNVITAARQVLGTKQWSAFKEAARLPSGRIPTAKVEDLLNVLTEAAGAGNS